jgi:hypothetical protein
MSEHDAGGGRPGLVLGPILRHVGRHEATVWVETDQPAEVEILGRREPTFCIAGHHFALLTLGGLPEGAELPYEVRLDGAAAWPPPGGPVSTIRTLAPGRPLRMLAGSCRQVAPNEPKWNDTSGDGESIGPDALWAWARAMQEGWVPRPDVLVHAGD